MKHGSGDFLEEKRDFVHQNVLSICKYVAEHFLFLLSAFALLRATMY